MMHPLLNLLNGRSQILNEDQKISTRYLTRIIILFFSLEDDNRCGEVALHL
jgi:hypothetical protein